MTAQSHPHVVATYPTQGAAWLNAARVQANTGQTIEVRQAVEVRGGRRFPIFVLAAVTESGAQVAAELLATFGERGL